MNKKIYYSKEFKKNYKARYLGQTKIQKQIETRINLFLSDRNNPILRDHKLVGIRHKQRSFSVTGDIRIIYIEFEDYYLFLDIGTHSQVY